VKKQYMRKLFPSAFALLVTFVVSAQTPAIGQWRDQFPYSHSISVAEAPDRVYCASSSGIFALVKADNSLERLSKINGLSDIDITKIKFNPYNNKLLIAYRNGNLDVLSNRIVTNVPDIKNSSLVGNKRINAIYFVNQYAYLSCGFGIVVFDTDKMEVHDTYYIGNNASYVNVEDIAIDAQNIYAATATCVYQAALSSNLVNFANWSIMTGASSHTLPVGIFNQIVSFQGKVYANYSRQQTQSTWRQDTTYCYDPNTQVWKVWETGTNVYSLKVDNGWFVTLHEGECEVFDTTMTRQNWITGYPFGGYPIPNEAIKASGSGTDVWIADVNNGLIHCKNTYNADSRYPNGPRNPDVYAMSYSNGTISVAPGAHADNWGNQYNTAGISTLVNNEWHTLDYHNTPILGRDFDFIATAIDPNNPLHVMYGSLGFGVFETMNGNLSNIYNYDHHNCTLKPVSTTDTLTWVGGMAYDPAGNLWVTNLFAGTMLNCREANGTWHAFDCSSVISYAEIGQILVGKNGLKWAVLPRGRGILVYDDRGTLANPNDDRIKRLTFTKGNGGISGTEVFSIVEDKDGQIWVGTDAGICVFYNPDNMFASSGFDAQQILIQQGVHVQILMETQSVTALAIDGANRKWIGTASGGAFLMSADGTQQIQNFNKDNSPLLSNTISAITVNQITGEIFFGTDRGIISYRSTATEGSDVFDNVFAFPNPVKHDYEGPIAIKGLTTNAEVKITDIAGQLIYQTTALGGQAIWNGKNFKGERARTGVYIVFCSDTDGKQTFVTKILFIN
jgi:hypothetical protein